MIFVLVVFIGYQLYRIVLNPTVGLIALTIFDALVLALTWREYRQQRQTRTEEAVTDPTGAGADKEDRSITGRAEFCRGT